MFPFSKKKHYQPKFYGRFIPYFGNGLPIQAFLEIRWFSECVCVCVFRLCIICIFMFRTANH